MEIAASEHLSIDLMIKLRWWKLKNAGSTKDP